ncbi:MAG: hypothetical protein OXI43_08755 [Candidatus Poribacteria bacterium]|nr:hypothetical protein [Candidatus Poribacteria bacterium]
MSFTPKLDKNLPEGLSRKIAIEQGIVDKAIGKTISKVKAAMRKPNPGLHESNVLMIEFTDGSILWIQTASNVDNVISYIEHSKNKIKPPDFHADLFYSWENNDEDES